MNRIAVCRRPAAMEATVRSGDGAAHETLISIRQTALDILRRLHLYWERRQANRRGLVYCFADRRPQGAFSGRFLADIMIGYLALGDAARDGRFLEPIPGLLAEIANRQDASGAFRWNLPDPGSSHPLGVKDQVDLAMVLDALSRLIECDALDGKSRAMAFRICEKAIAYLRTAEIPGKPGIIRKRDYEGAVAPSIDVLNGDAMAAKSFAIAAVLLKRDSLFEIADRFLGHLKNRFGRHYPGWWPYSESLEDQRVVPADRKGTSVFFQSMMLVHLRDIARHPRFEAYRPMLAQGMQTIGECVAPDGRIDFAHESRFDCIGKPNALVADALLGLHFAPALEKARRRLDLIGRHLVTSQGDALDEKGNPVDEIWRIWLFSDLARLVLGMKPGRSFADR